MKARGYDRGVPRTIDIMAIDDGKYMQPKAAEAFLKMQAAAREDGIDLHPNSAWRSYEHQQVLWNRYEHRLARWSDNPSEYKKPLRPARPGFSRHHLGLAVDINRCHDDPDGLGPELGETDKWLAEHARKFGFYRTVAKELWHWEFLDEVLNKGEEDEKG